MFGDRRSNFVDDEMMKEPLCVEAGPDLPAASRRSHDAVTEAGETSTIIPTFFTLLTPGKRIIALSRPLMRHRAELQAKKPIVYL
jgi:hypothetical protein